ncbi:DUF6361 family protein [Desulfovibrio sp. OttesenSCG-928-G15]|nr:DUF6361 family protein [Desulfovibrio sp. OttesenSCG-928-G15]
MQTGWIDFSRDERNRIIKALSLLEQPGAVDELGIGVVRDAYSDILFPGISTLQKRAKYFVLIPYIFAQAEKQSFGSADDVLPWVEKQEDAMASFLIHNSRDADRWGIHGLLSHNHIVKQKPSAIYWGGASNIRHCQARDHFAVRGLPDRLRKEPPASKILAVTKGRHRF